MAVDLTFLTFRLIPLLTSFYRVFEKVIYTRIYQDISQNNILVNEQYGCSKTLQQETSLIY